jgi:hypothetical protein
LKIVNDAAMQAIGSYQGDEMLFLGLGTGLGSALITHGMLQPLELAHLPYNKGRTYEDYLGKKKWSEKAFEIVPALCAAFQVDYVVLGGGNAKLLDNLPKNTRRGGNGLAFDGGFRLWDPESPIRVDCAGPYGKKKRPRGGALSSLTCVVISSGRRHRRRRRNCAHVPR